MIYKVESRRGEGEPPLASPPHRVCNPQQPPCPFRSTLAAFSRSLLYSRTTFLLSGVAATVACCFPVATTQPAMAKGSQFKELELELQALRRESKQLHQTLAVSCIVP